MLPIKEKYRMETRPAQIEGAAVRGPNQSVSEASNRRAMKDIGNLVEDTNGNCNVSREKVLGKPPRPCATRRITRVYGAASHFNAHEIHNKEIFINKQPQAEAANYQWMVSKRQNIPFALVDAKCGTEDNSMINEQTHRVNTTQKHKLQALPGKVKAKMATEILTSQSAFYGGFDAEMTEAEDLLPSIDRQELENQMAVVEYVEEIYKSYHETESMSCVPDYMPSQLDLAGEMRAMLIDWLVEVHWKCQLMPETLYLTTNLIDRYLSIEPVSRKYLQLVGATAMFLACKYEEVCPPGVDDLVYYSSGAYTRQQLLAMEKTMLSKLNFILTIPTHYVFLTRCLKAADSDKKMENLVFFLSELSLLEYVMIKFTPSLFAAAAVYTARCALKKAPIWNDLLTQYTGYSEADLLECAKLMVQFHHNSAESSLKVVHEKYSSIQFGCVAFISPAKLPAQI
ncbi:G2/mitotic-specific cyclin S13-7 isoform X2 [Cryptomeria japonica]|uniref:G2/mitotic-specific cyclin S13-7 isoform X2 n=1 Tax=Cryptomeria japonica TaxID=3369 RepID=UPI0025AD0385|nr:G2/mitotic-specific cyclin S13-7 isoform X2 [Cryptomeria japonica]